LTDAPIELPGPSLTDGMRFLRTRAVAAHEAGDGFAVNHICRVALAAIGQRLTPHPTRIAGLTLGDVRWVFSLWLSWLPGYELVRDETGMLPPARLAKQLAVTPEDIHDLTLLSFLFVAFADPLAIPDIGPLVTLPEMWLESRTNETEDVSAFSLAVECAWYGNPASGPWRHLVSTWRGHCPSGSRLAGALERLDRRLSTQAALCIGGQPGPMTARPPGAPVGASPIERCWQAFLDCDWTLLDQLIQQLSATTRTDTNDYFPLFSLIRYSSPFRQGTGSQSLSLSRRAYSLSRQPGQVFTDFRSHSFTSNAIRLRLQAQPIQGADERWKCFLLAMLGQLSALRSWDIGRWFEAVGQQADAHLELARFGEPVHAMYGLSSAVLALRAVEKGKHPLAERAVLLLDLLPTERRTDFVRWLLQRRLVEWRGAHSVLAVLSDAIPEPMLPDVARWSTALALSEKRLWGWSLSYIDFWGDILPHVPHAPSLIEILLPAVLQACATPPMWQIASEAIAQCMVAADGPVARQIGDQLLATLVPPTSPEADLRWSIVFQACDGRRELLTSYEGYLLAPPGDTPVRTHLVRRIVENVPPSTSIDDPSLRDWLRAQARAHCARLLSPGHEAGIFPPPFPPPDFRLTTWPAEEPELVGDMLKVADAPQVWYVNKVSIIDGLRQLTRELPERAVDRIAEVALRWLQDGLPGSGPPPSGPLSTAHLEGFDVSTTAPALLSLVETVLFRLPDQTADPIAEWLTAQGIRTPADAADIVFLLMARLALRAGGDARGLIGLTEVVVEHTAASDPTRCILTFAYLLAPQDGSRSLIVRTIRSAACKTMLRFWQRRLQEYARHHLPRVRLAAAQALRAWQEQASEHAALALPDSLQEAITILSQDARASVRWTLQRPQEDAI
jgi:hypothetical protein